MCSSDLIVMEHWDDTGMGIVMSTVLEHCDDKGNDHFDDKVRGGLG